MYAKKAVPLHARLVPAISFNQTIVVKNNKHIVKEIVFFGIVGAIVTGIHYGLYYILNRIMPVNVAYTIGYIVALFCNFYLSAHCTFKSKTSYKKGVGFALAHGINYILHMLLLNLFLWIGISETVAPIPVLCIAVPVNFLLVRYIFTSKKFQK